MRTNGLSEYKELNAEFKSLKKIVVDYTENEKAACMKSILNRAEIVEVIIPFSVFYDRFLQYCTNMKVLRVYCVEEFDWLFHTYPKQERLVYDLNYKGDTIEQLMEFFVLNPDVQHIAVPDGFIEDNR